MTHPQRIQLRRITYDEGHAGDCAFIDEIVTDGAMLECMDGDAKGGKIWFLAMRNADGTEVAVWFTGRITLMETRDAPQRKETI